MNRRHYNYYELKDGLFGAVVAFGILIALLLCLLINIIGILTSLDLWKNDIGTFIAIGLIFPFYLFLHYTLLSEDKWRKYEEEFKTYSLQRNRRINGWIILSVILLFILLSLSFIIWK
jgi:hypothetical protein